MTEEVVYKKVLSGQPCLDKEGCGSSDAMAIYFPEDAEGNPLPKNAHCFSCEQNFNESDLKELDIDTPEGLEQYIKATKPLRKAGGEPLTKEQAQAIQKRASRIGHGFRGIDDETLAFYKVLTEYDNETGDVKKRYYPNTINYQRASYQVRVVKEKFFFFIGKAGIELDFFGQRNFKDGGSRLLLVGGQEDCLAASQMLYSYQCRKGNAEYGRPAVVSTPSGENCATYVKNNYAWFDKFDEIIVGLDNDEAGEKATESIVPLLPKGKVKIAKWSAKDPNDMLKKGLQTKFIDDYYRAKPHVPVGILDTSQLSTKVREALLIPKMGLPPFMSELEHLMRGGVPVKKITNITAETGVGKTTTINEIIYHWIFLEGCLPGVVTLELDAPEYAMTLLSRHIGKKLSLFENPQEALNFVDQPWVVEKENQLYFDEKGDPRWYLVDDRAQSVEDVKDKIEELVVTFGCNIIVLDPMTDLIGALTNAEQRNFMTWQKSMIKSHDVGFFNINHVRGAPADSDASPDKVRFLTEDDIEGSKSISKSAHCNIFISRNKNADDEMVKNTTSVWMPKCRWTGLTGKAGYWYYDNDSHKMWDLETYKRLHASKDGQPAAA